MSYTSIAFQLAHASRASSNSAISLSVLVHYRAPFSTRTGDHAQIRFPRALRGSGHRQCGDPVSCGGYSSASAKLADVNDNPKRQTSLISLQGSAKLRFRSSKVMTCTTRTCRCAREPRAARRLFRRGKRSPTSRQAARHGRMDRIAKTRPITDSRPGLPRRAVHHLAVELSETAKFALPMVLAQGGQIVMMTTDLAFIGRIGPDALAAAALAIRVYLLSFTLGLGLLAAIAPLAAQAFGANKLAVLRRAVRMGMWAAVLLSFPIVAFAFRGEQMLLAFGQPPNTARLAQQYLFGLSWGVAPALCFDVIRSFLGAVNRPKPVLWITLTASPINALVVYLLIHGEFGLPRLELFGAGLATTLVNWAIFLVGLWLATTHPNFRGYRVLAHVWRFDSLSMRQLLVMGMPISIASLTWYGLFSATALLAGSIDTHALAAHQIALQIDRILLTISFGISMAAAVRVGHAVGRNDGPAVKRAGSAAMLLGIAITAILTFAAIAARFEIAKLFLRESADNADATIGLAANLLLVGASMFVTDSLGSIAWGALRGLKDTRVPLLFSFIAYWLIGFPVSYLLSLQTNLGAIGIWIGLSIGASVLAALLVLRFMVVAARLS